jgi:hypothetical protein
MKCMDSKVKFYVKIGSDKTNGTTYGVNAIVTLKNQLSWTLKKFCLPLT